MPANVDETTIKELWSSSKIQAALRKENPNIELLEASLEVVELFKKEAITSITYNELAAIPAVE